MKKLILILCIVLGTIQLTSAQTGSGFGIKGGLNYGSNGNYSSSTGENIKHPDKNIGFHLGVFGKFGDAIYLKPEVIYSETSSTYTNDDFKFQKVDTPVLIGVTLIKPFSIFAGPTLQYVINAKLNGLEAEPRSEDITIGFNVGFAFNFNRIGIDLRYEQGFNAYEFEFITNHGADVVTIDSRPEQLILSVSFRL